MYLLVLVAQTGMVNCAFYEEVSNILDVLSLNVNDLSVNGDNGWHMPVCTKIIFFLVKESFK